MKIEKKPVKVFKILNRRGYAAICCDCLTEGPTKEQAIARMTKAVRRVFKKKK